jgi:cell division protein FtsW
LLDPTQKITAASYHTNQIAISLGSGGIFGKGLGNSSQKYQFLPEITSDSILAVIGEETGFVGVAIVVYLYILLVVAIFKIAKSTTDSKYQLLASGVAIWIGYQSLINISAIASIIPLTGVPLPFVSSGGSSIVTSLAAIGIILNIERLNKANNSKTTND